MTTLTTNQVGNRAEGEIAALFLQQGVPVLLPFGPTRYDLVVEIAPGVFKRVQCKSGRIRKGCVVFNAYSAPHGQTRKGYRGDADYFGVYCHDNDSIYLVPVADVGTCETTLRLDPPLNSQVKRVRLASKYLVARK